MSKMGTLISPFALLTVLEGVTVAAQFHDEDCSQLSNWISQAGGQPETGISEHTWSAKFSSDAFKFGEDIQNLFSIALGLSILREKSRSGIQLSAADIDKVWEILRRTLTKVNTTRVRYKVSRSAPGYLAVPLCSLVREGNIDELFRLHVWLPDGQRGMSEVGIHSHQPFTQSWILAGQGTNYTYLAEHIDDPQEATHAEYVLRWDDGKQAGSMYKTFQVSSTVTSTKNLYRVQQIGVDKHSRDMTYCVHAGDYHWPTVADGQFCATLFYFDSSRGFVKTAGVLGPMNGQDYTQIRDPGPITPWCLVNMTDAIRSWEQAKAIHHESQDEDEVEDDVVLAYYKLFVGGTLITAGKRDEALKLFDSGRCPAIVAFSRESSQRHRKYLQELVDSGVDIDITDDKGYKALDYAVLNEDTSAEAIIVDGYRKRFDKDVAGDKVSRLEYEAQIRKAYHSLFETHIRPILHSKRKDTMEAMRHVYANALETDKDKRGKFDGLRYLWYTDFICSPRLPRYMDGRVKMYSANPASEENAEYIIFLSYRWIHKDPVTGKTAPDNKEHTQFQRMLKALDLFLDLHPLVNRHKLGIWMDSVCIDRRDPMPGISALPINIAQCNALITISDEIYWERAWCSVEALMFQILRTSYTHYEWYEYMPVQHRVDNVLEDEIWELREAPPDVEIDMSKTAMTWEEDRAKIQFLERQARLLAA